jgi:hypothetical protein
MTPTLTQRLCAMACSQQQASEAAATAASSSATSSSKKAAKRAQRLAKGQVKQSAQQLLHGVSSATKLQEAATFLVQTIAMLSDLSGTCWRLVVEGWRLLDWMGCNYISNDGGLACYAMLRQAFTHYGEQAVAASRSDTFLEQLTAEVRQSRTLLSTISYLATKWSLLSLVMMFRSSDPPPVSAIGVACTFLAVFW